MSLIKNISTVIILLMIMVTVPYLIYEWHSHENIGSNEMGYVTKDIYNHYGSEQTIILITGIHPRENLAINPEIESAKRFALTHNARMVNYNVTVTKDPEDYKNSRYNGEHLVSEFVLPDIYKSKADAVIISHSHIEGYGEGFYIATPAMDEASVKLAENIKNSEIDFLAPCIITFIFLQLIPFFISIIIFVSFIKPDNNTSKKWINYRN